MSHPANKLFPLHKKFLFLILFFFLLPSSSLRAAKNAIGIRVVRNAEHLSPSAWYEKYAPVGDKKNVPSSISFAGYEAVSVGSCASGNGETIYVNAANIDGGNLWTNIYIIACPIGADQDIADIFDQLIKNWDFNVNIGKSEQNKIQRDTKRLSDITVLNNLLGNYRASNSRYPELASGTYEVGKSISDWTSWNDTLGAKLQSKLPTPPIGQGWGALTNLENWTNSNGEKVWPKDMYFPNAVGVDYTFGGCRQITAVKDQKVASWCEGGCAECGALSYSTTDLWPTGTNPVDIAVSYQNPKAPSCREFFVVQNGKFSILKDNYSAAVSGCSNVFSPDSAQDLSKYISNWPDELKDPTSIAIGIDHNNCKRIFVVKENRWSEYTEGDSCSNVGWTPAGELNSVPETLGIEWPEDVQNPDAVSLAWDKDGQRHIYAFKGDSYREYIDYNKPYIYQTADNGLSYSLCTYFETAYSALSGINCSKLQSSNYPPTITKLTDQKITIGNYFNYNITAADIDGDELSWSVDLDDSGNSCSSCDAIKCSCGWLTFTNTTEKNIKKIYGFAPNAVETRTITITVKDGKSGTDAKSFKLDVIKSDLVITSLPPADIIIGDDYQYDVEAYDPQGYYPLTYSWGYVAPSTNFPSDMTATSINSTNGVIFGTPTNVGLYNVKATVKNNNPSGAETASQPFKINVRNFDVVDIPDTEIERDHIIKFFAKTDPEKVKKIKWEIACSSTNADCAKDISYKIDQTSGEITISANNSAALYDVFKMTATAVSDLNSTIKHSKSFNVMISNPKCGNGTVEGAEQCDDGADGNNANQCYDDCKFTYCGDGIVQKPNGKEGITEDCDKNNPICCDNATCKWSCPPYITAGPLNFGSGNNYIETQSGVSQEIIFPACRIFDAGSGKIDAEIIPNVSSTAVVYVTDTSGSMGSTNPPAMPDVISALKAQMNKLNVAAKASAMIAAGKSIFVGLVRFSSSFTFSPIVDIQSDAKTKELIDTIETYTAGGGTSADPAFVQAVAMLNGIVADKKIIVFLGDGASDTNPTATTTAAKAAGIEIYGIAYNGGPASICSWSSDSSTITPPCWSSHYSYKSADAASVYATITAKIIALPTGNITLTINGKDKTFVAPKPGDSLIVPNIPLNLSGITCGDVNQNVSFVVNYTGGGGKIKFYNTRVDICKSCLSTE